MRMLVRLRWLAVATVLGSLVGFLVSYLFIPRYSASARNALSRVKTVEAALTRIYRKLDVRSRTQLATLLVPAPTE